MVSSFMSVSREDSAIIFSSPSFQILILYLYSGIHVLHFGYHRLLSKRIPFAIYYRVQKEIIRVYAILDCRRNPTWIRNRLS